MVKFSIYLNRRVFVMIDFDYNLLECQSPFSGKNKNNFTNLLYGELAKSIVKVK